MLFPVNFRKTTYLLLGYLLLIGCQKVQKMPVNRAFYYWKSNFQLSTPEKKLLLDTLHISKLYIKYFDVIWNEAEQKAVPVADLNYKTAPIELASIEFIPTVFIRNDVFLNVTDTVQLDSLASRVLRKIDQKNNTNGLKTPAEIQLDCDWSLKTKQAYFYFLQKLQAKNAAIFYSATIRLHQLKYPKQTGVPPVQKGMLMVYNMSDVAKAATKNSILDLKITKTYVANAKNYAIPLDVALPIFQWSALFRGQKLVGLFNNYTERNCRDTPFLHPTTGNWWQVSKDTVIATTYWRRGDRLRVEGGTIEEIRGIHPLIEPFLKANKSTVVSLFYCDSLLFSHHTSENLENIFDDY